VILAETADEACGVSLERLDAYTLAREAHMLEDEDSFVAVRRVFPWPEGEVIPAFDYLNPRRLIVAQSASEWAAHYGRPLLMRAYTEVACLRRRCAYVYLWHLAQVSPERSKALNEIHAQQLPEKERRRLVADWARRCGIAARAISSAAQVHAEIYLPACMRKRAR
jgi:hypothetical protein